MNAVTLLTDLAWVCVTCSLLVPVLIIATAPIRALNRRRRARFVAEVTALTADNVALAAELDDLNGRLQDLLDTVPMPWDETGEGLAEAQFRAECDQSLDIAAIVPLPGRRLSSVPTQRGAVD